jgi:hypothetical protein
MAAGRGGQGEEPLGGTMTAGPRCSDDDGDVKVGFAAPSRVVRLQEEKIYLVCVKIKSDCHILLAGKGIPKAGSSSNASDLYSEGAWIETWPGYLIL